jgi:hypothetical protein
MASPFHASIPSNVQPRDLSKMATNMAGANQKAVFRNFQNNIALSLRCWNSPYVGFSMHASSHMAILQTYCYCPIRICINDFQHGRHKRKAEVAITRTPILDMGNTSTTTSCFRGCAAHLHVALPTSPNVPTYFKSIWQPINREQQ